MNRALALPYSLLAATAAGLARLPLSGDGKLSRTFHARRGAIERFEAWGRTGRDPARPLIWLHAPSVGEGLQARPVLELIRARHPAIQLAYTFFSPSAERFAASLDVDFADCLPFDSAAAARRTLTALRPSLVVFAKLDLWPRFAEASAARGVPLAMISATLSAGSRRGGFFAKALLGDAYAALGAVGAIDAADRDRLIALGVAPARVAVTGDTRYDQVAARAESADRNGALLAPLASHRPTLVAGSTWPADEAVLFAAWAEVRRVVPDARLIIAPHEPTETHLEPVRRWAAAARLSLVQLGDARADSDVILVERTGVLGELYALADAAYVGGGFHAAGLHSVLEPAAFGAPTLFGPRHTKSRDAGLLIARRGGVAVPDARSLADALCIVLTEPDTRATAGAAARAVVESGLGAAERATALVMQLLSAPGPRV